MFVKLDGGDEFVTEEALHVCSSCVWKLIIQYIALLIIGIPGLSNAAIPFIRTAHGMMASHSSAIWTKPRMDGTKIHQ